MSSLPGAPARLFFDDFAYTDSGVSRLGERGWTVRSGTGGPGIPGARWSTSAVSFPTMNGNPVLRLESVTDGTATGTVHAEVYQRRKFREGTYAARIQFSDAPVTGPDGDRLVQAFFTISPLAHDMDPAYSELDFEYLPNGGWNQPVSALYATSWETYGTDPWRALNTQTAARASYLGWHDLAIQVADGRSKYYVDGRLFADHGEPYYPESLMSINISQWFIAGGLRDSAAPRGYRLHVDYIYFVKDQVLAPAEIAGQIARYRAAGITHVDTV